MSMISDYCFSCYEPHKHWYIKKLCNRIKKYLWIYDWIFLIRRDHQYLWLCLSFCDFYRFLSKASWEKLTKHDTTWIILSLIWWVIFACNNLVFKNISWVFWPVESAYILEFSSLIPLTLLYLIGHKKQDIINMKKDGKKLWILFLTAPLILLSWYGLAQSVNSIPFYIFNSLFVIVLVFSIVFSWIFLKEKFSLTRWVSLLTMILWCLMIVLL